MPDGRAIAIGAVIFAALTAATMLLIDTAIGQYLFWLFYAAPVVSGAVTGYVARRHEFVSLLFLGVIDAACLRGAKFHFLGTWFSFRSRRL